MYKCKYNTFYDLNVSSVEMQLDFIKLNGIPQVTSGNSLRDIQGYLAETYFNGKHFVYHF